jgi:hypothetical protein
LSIQPFNVTTSFLTSADSVEVIWNLQAGAIVVGHILAVLAAHRLSLALYPDEYDVVMSQLPLAVIMVAYTLFGLWLLATPTGA